MKKNHEVVIVMVLILLISNLFSLKVNSNEKNFNMIVKKEPTAQSPTATVSGELIPVNVKNEFDEEIKVKLDTNREYPVGPNEWITLGKRKPGRYTLTIYNKKGEFVDNLTKNIDNKNKFVLNNNTISNSGKITGLSTGQKVAITAGAIGAAALGTALINKALHGGEQVPGQAVLPQVPVQAPVVEQPADANNAFAADGKVIKFLNKLYDRITLIVEGTDGNPVGNNWIIPKAKLFDKPQPLVYDGEKITISSNQKVKALLPNGAELQRNAFELKTDPLDGSYVWVIE